MAHFVDGWGRSATGYPQINLDHVAIAKKRPRDEHGKSHGWDCFDVNGDLVGIVDSISDAAVVVPNHTGARVCVFYTDMSGWEFLPIVAWRIADSRADPITIEDLTSYETWYITYDGGMGSLPREKNAETFGTIYCAPDDTTILGFDRAMAYAREQYEAKVKRQADHDEKSRLAAQAVSET